MHLSSYPPPVRQQVLEQMSVLDIVFATQTDKALGTWMRERNMWTRVWKRLPGVTVSVGPDARKNCLAWYFALVKGDMIQPNNFKLDDWLMHPTRDVKVSIDFPYKDAAPIGKMKTIFVRAMNTSSYLSEASDVLREVSSVLEQAEDDYDIGRGGLDMVLTFRVPHDSAMNMRVKIFYIFLDMGFQFQVKRDDNTYNIKEKL